MRVAAPGAVLVIGILCAAPDTAAAFDEDFTGATLRIDLYHSGTAHEEQLALDRVRVEGAARSRPEDSREMWRLTERSAPSCMSLSPAITLAPRRASRWASTSESVPVW